ncbi:MAG: hypothetical protein AAF415_02540 [Pseudomonadota bacterium]
MRIRRLKLTLPPRMKGTASQDARMIAQAIAEKLGPEAGQRISLDLQGNGAPGATLAQQIGARIAPKSGSKTGGRG